MMELEPGRLADVLLSQSWQIAVVFGVVAVICWLSRRSSAHWRYLLWLIVVVKCLTPPIVRVPVGVLPSDGATPAAFHTSGERGGSVAVHAVGSRSELLPGVADVDPSAEAGAQGVAAHLSSGVVPDLGEQQIRRSLSVEVWLGVVWAIGAAAFLLYAVLKAWHIRRRLKLSRELADAAVQGEAEALCRRMGIRVPPAVYLVDGFSQPFVWGLLRGDVYLPSVVAADANHRRKILAHELAHVARWDAAVNALQVLVQGLFFFHPLVWWANRQIRRERESCCDEAAIAVLAAPPQDYSRAIVDSLIHGRGRATPALSVAGPAKNVEARIRAIMRPDRIFRARPTRAAVLTVLVLAVAALIVGLVPTRRARAEDQNQVGAEKITMARSSSGAEGPVRSSGSEGDVPTARLSDGVIVKLVAVSRVREKPRRWWRPDGVLLSVPPAGSGNSMLQHEARMSDDALAYTFVVHVNKDVFFQNRFSDPRCATSGGMPTLLTEKPLQYQHVFSGLFPDDDIQQIDVSIGVSTEAGQILGQYGATQWTKLSTHKDGGIVFHSPYQEGEDLIVIASHADHEPYRQTWLVAYGREGGRHGVERRSSATADGVVSSRYVFAGLSLDDVQRFELRSRSYEWVTFQNVSLRPGQQTSIEVVSTRPGAALPGVERGQIDRDASSLAEMMGLVENFFMHNFKDVTWRKSIEWGEVQKNKDGARSIRYMYEARIWDRETMVMNQVFTFAEDGTFVRYENVEGFPKPKEAKVADVSSQEGMIELVEDFFRNNFRDITNRETIEWGQVAKDEKGNASIRYKYRATIWGKDKKVLDQIFTFDPSGKFVSVKDVQESSQKQKA